MLLGALLLAGYYVSAGGIRYGAFSGIVTPQLGRNNQRNGARQQEKGADLMKLLLRDLSKSFNDHVVLDRVSLALEKVHTLVLIGPSGGGKTTLLRIIAGLEYPTAGELEINDDRVVFEEDSLLKYRRTIGTVFQAFNLFPHLTALQNITLPLEKVHAHKPAQALEIARQHLQRFRLEQHAAKRPAELSGGQRQRVAIARAVAIKPRLLLFDEPTSALDPEMTAEVLDMIREVRQAGADFILVTHEMGFARQIADHVALLAEGRIVEAGPVEQVFEYPTHPQSRDFLAKVLKY
jgi:polar amino acid transport system ATP-binding protein